MADPCKGTGGGEEGILQRDVLKEFVAKHPEVHASIKAGVDRAISNVVNAKCMNGIQTVLAGKDLVLSESFD
jgi:hypothetical protein